MEWLPALLKHLSIARSGILALFVASAALYFGPRFIPGYFETLPQEWSFAVIGIFIFSACLLLLWGVSYTWTVIKKVGGSLTTNFSALWLNGLERGLLLVLAVRPTEPINLESVNYSEANFSHLELLQASYQLQRKGLAQVNRYNDNLVTLTEKGRKRALKLQRKNKENTT